ncbi:hypothetical protein ABNC90_12865, partial [Paenibacillus larvae]
EGYEYGSFHFLEPSFLHNYTDSTSAEIGYNSDNDYQSYYFEIRSRCYEPVVSFNHHNSYIARGILYVYCYQPQPEHATYV